MGPIVWRWPVHWKRTSELQNPPVVQLQKIRSWKFRPETWYWSNYSDLTRPIYPQKVGGGREIPLFQGNIGWWNSVIWPDRRNAAAFCFKAKAFGWAGSWQVIATHKETVFAVCEGYPLWLIQVALDLGRKRGTISWMRFCLKQNATTAIQSLMLRWFQSLLRMPCHFSKLWFYCTCWHPTCLVFTHPAPWNCKASSDGPGETNSFHGQTRLPTAKTRGATARLRQVDKEDFARELAVGITESADSPNPRTVEEIELRLAALAGAVKKSFRIYT